MPIELSQRCQAVKPSATLAVSQKARELKDQGINVISLSAGEPDFNTPEHIKQAAIDAINANHTHYTNVDGIPPLKQAIVDKFERENNLSFNTDNILTSVGAKHSITNLMQALLNPGDEVIIPCPYWVSYPDMVALTGAKSVFIQTDIHQHFKITAEQLDAAITDKTKLILFNSPSNPSGAEYNADELKAIGEVVKKYPKVIFATDDIYEHLRWGPGQFHTLLNVCPELKNQVVILNGVSKAYAMTGWRIGYAAGPADLIKGMKKIQSQMTSNPCSIAQYAAVAALNGGLDCVKPMVEAFKRRSEFTCNALNQLDGFHCLSATASLYVFPRVDEVISRLGLKDDIEFAGYLLDRVHIAAVPGTPFGCPGYMRISIAAADKNLKEAMKRLQKL